MQESIFSQKSSNGFCRLGEYLFFKTSILIIGSKNKKKKKKKKEKKKKTSSFKGVAGMHSAYCNSLAAVLAKLPASPQTPGFRMLAASRILSFPFCVLHSTYDDPCHRG